MECINLKDCNQKHNYMKWFDKYKKKTFKSLGRRMPYPESFPREQCL